MGPSTWGELIAGASEFLDRLAERGVKRFFLSNNSSRSVPQYLKKLDLLGIPAKEEEVLLSTHDLLRWLEAEGIDDTFLVGTRGMGDMLEARGIRTQSKSPQAVVLGYDTEITYQKLSDASMHLHAGVPLIASHPDPGVSFACGRPPRCRGVSFTVRNNYRSASCEDMR